jgi:hypothetical protein
MSPSGPSRHFAAARKLGRFRSEAEIKGQGGSASLVANDPQETFHSKLIECQRHFDVHPNDHSGRSLSGLRPGRSDVSLIRYGERNVATASALQKIAARAIAENSTDLADPLTPI